MYYLYISFLISQGLALTADNGHYHNGLTKLEDILSCAGDRGAGKGTSELCAVDKMSLEK